MHRLMDLLFWWAEFGIRGHGRAGCAKKHMPPSLGCAQHAPKIWIRRILSRTSIGCVHLALMDGSGSSSATIWILANLRYRTSDVRYCTMSHVFHTMSYVTNRMRHRTIWATHRTFSSSYRMRYRIRYRIRCFY